MLRRSLVVAAAVVAVALSASAANRPDADLSGNWLITYSTPTTEFNYCIVKIETKDGKPTASVVANGLKGLNVSVKSVQVSGKEVSITLSNSPSFVGTVGADPKVVLGSFGTDQQMFRAKMVRTEAETIDTPSVRVNPPEQMAKAQAMTSRPLVLRNQARAEKDADKKKDLLAQADEAQKQADEEVPGLYREVIAKNAADPVAADAATALLAQATRAKLTPDEARTLVKLIDKHAAPYGPRYVRFNMVRVGKGLAAQKGFEPIAVEALKPVVDGLTDKDPAAGQVDVLGAYKTALEASGRADEAKAIDARLVKLETKLDEEYLASVPPFKPTAYAGRKEKGANRVAVMELFTGAQCPPCVAADAAFDGLVKAYKPTDVVLIQYHMHIPGPDPMTNPDTVARWDYYREKFPEGIRGVPSSLFNGKPAAGGGGGMANAETKYNQYSKLIDPLLEETTPVKVGGKASRAGDTVKFSVEVNGLESTDDLKLRVLVVEDTVKFVGSNGIRFHHHVVRAMPGGPAGVAILLKSFTHTGSADVGTIRTGLTKYLDDFAANERPFPQPARPLDMKELSVIALVQNEKTGEIIQAAHIDVGGKSAAGR
jgi:hypothetical protein